MPAQKTHLFELKKLESLHERIERDVDQLSTIFNNPGSNAECALFIIYLYSSIENNCRLFKKHMLNEWESGELFLSPIEINFLESKDLRIKTNGEMDIIERRSSLEADLKCTLKILLAKKRIAQDPTKNNWSLIGCATTIRNRIIHPKSDADMDVSQKDIDTCFEAWKLVEGITIDYFNSTQIRLTKRINDERASATRSE